MGIYIAVSFVITLFVANIPIRQHASGKNRESKYHRNRKSLREGLVVLMDGDSGRILFEKNGREPLPNASTTKLLTCILALENGNTELRIVTASAYAASMPQVAIGVKAGEQYYLKDILYSLMLESHNDSAVMLAEHIAGDTKAFADMMNEKAKEIGCTDTFFVTPNGLDAEGED